MHIYKTNMKTLTTLVNESKEKPLYDAWEMREYLEYCVNRWMENTNRFCNILTSCDYWSKLGILRHCELLFNILEKFSDEVPMIFYDRSSEEDKKKYSGVMYGPHCVFVRAFAVLQKLVEVEDPWNNNSNVKTSTNTPDLKSELADLKTRYNSFADDCNKKWKAEFDKKSSNMKCEAIPCGCDCCCAY